MTEQTGLLSQRPRVKALVDVAKRHPNVSTVEVESNRTNVARLCITFDNATEATVHIYAKEVRQNYKRIPALKVEAPWARKLAKTRADHLGAQPLVDFMRKILTDRYLQLVDNAQTEQLRADVMAKLAQLSFPLVEDRYSSRLRMEMNECAFRITVDMTKVGDTMEVQLKPQIAERWSETLPKHFFYDAKVLAERFEAHIGAGVLQFKTKQLSVDDAIEEMEFLYEQLNEEEV